MSIYLLTECQIVHILVPIHAKWLQDFRIRVIIEILTNIEGVMVVANLLF
jgi:hypothetical protein